MLRTHNSRLVGLAIDCSLGKRAEVTTNVVVIFGSCASCLPAPPQPPAKSAPAAISMPGVADSLRRAMRLRGVDGLGMGGLDLGGRSETTLSPSTGKTRLPLTMRPRYQRSWRAASGAGRLLGRCWLADPGLIT